MIKKQLFILATCLLWGASTLSQTPREQLFEMSRQLGKSPNDIELRMRVIKLASEITPPPETSEEANRSFVRGNVFFKEAKDAPGYDLAIAAYNEALRFAPWWGDAYFNLAIAQEAVGKYDDAINSTKFFMASLPSTSPEYRKAQNSIYAVEAKAEIASKQRTVASEKPPAAAPSFAQQFEGRWRRDRQSFAIFRDSNGGWRMSGMMVQSSNPQRTQATYDERVEGAEFKFKDNGGYWDIGPAEYTGRLSADGTRLSFIMRDLPTSPYQQQMRQKWNDGQPPNDRFGGSDWRKE